MLTQSCRTAKYCWIALTVQIAGALALPSCSARPNQEFAIEAAEAATAAARSRSAEVSGTAKPINETAMGSICWAAILESISQVSKRCIDREDVGFREELDKSIARLDERFLATGWNAERLRAFKIQMGQTQDSIAALCSGNGLQIYQTLKRSGSDALKKATDEVLSQPGPPRWRTCL